MELLLLVRETPGISGKEVARRLCTAPNTVSTLVRDLTDAGLLARDRDPGDRRVLRLRVTGAARARMADYETNRAALLDEALAELEPPARAAILAAAPPRRAARRPAGTRPPRAGPRNPVAAAPPRPA
ncbi:MarR family transcriptional regulator [Micromonospora sp. BRA006-A]|nr:MarR family transcriptional regulator [Micromonospora sp. BRA006-A]